jgi:hypothetical protein
MRNFDRFDGGQNIPGYVHFYFVPDSAIDTIPAHNAGVIDLDNIAYTDGDEWYVGASILKTLNLGNEQKLTPDGPTYPVVIEGKAAKKSAYNLSLFHEMSYKRWIVLIKDLNGNYFICGEAGNGLSFSFKEVDGALSFVFGGSYRQPCWFASGNVNLDGVAVGIDYIPATTTIIGIDGLSAYQVAVENGFEGTEAEWLDSLQGIQGPQGPQGNDSSISFISAFAGM